MLPYQVTACRVYEGVRLRRGEIQKDAGGAWKKLEPEDKNENVRPFISSQRQILQIRSGRNGNDHIAGCQCEPQTAFIFGKN